jgi:hypothetical protein
LGISSLHLQFAGRFPSAPRGGKIARAGHFGQLGDAAQSRAANSVYVATPNASWFSSQKKSRNALFVFLSWDTRALFFSQENFSTAIENKIDFFLVGFATDF